MTTLNLDFGILGIGLAAAPIQDLSSCLTQRESAIVSSAIEKRVNEFSTGRFLAKQVLATLGHVDAEILKGRHGEPLWPGDVTGSISHCNRYAIATATIRSDIGGLGIDIEDVDSLPVELYDQVLTRHEQKITSDNSDQNEITATTVFSAKEALYKAVFPLTRQWIGFLDVELLPPLEGNKITVKYRGTDATVAACIERAVITIRRLDASIVSLCCIPNN